MSELADRTIDAVHLTSERLARLVGTLTDDDLATRSGTSEWTVAQVLSHLGSGAEITLATLRAGQAGTERPGDANRDVRARWDAMTPREQADGYLRAAGELDRAYAELDPAQRDSLRVPMAFLPEPADVEALPFRPGALAGAWANKCYQHLPAEALPRLLTGRLREADEERGVRADGAVSLDDLRRVFPGL